MEEKRPGSKSRWHLLKLLPLLLNTDEEHPVSRRQLEKQLGGVERKTIYKDIAAISGMLGWEIKYDLHKNGGWYLANRRFSREDIREVYDAVAAYRWLTPEAREALLGKVLELAPEPARKNLVRPAHIRVRYGDGLIANSDVIIDPKYFGFAMGHRGRIEMVAPEREKQEQGGH